MNSAINAITFSYQKEELDGRLGLIAMTCMATDTELFFFVFFNQCLFYILSVSAIPAPLKR